MCLLHNICYVQYMHFYMQMFFNLQVCAGEVQWEICKGIQAGASKDSWGMEEDH